jgi:hypothetical protein
MTSALRPHMASFARLEFDITALHARAAGSVLGQRRMSTVEPREAAAMVAITTSETLMTSDIRDFNDLGRARMHERNEAIRYRSYPQYSRDKQCIRGAFVLLAKTRRNSGDLVRGYGCGGVRASAAHQLLARVGTGRNNYPLALRSSLSQLYGVYSGVAQSLRTQTGRGRCARCWWLP